ncbi:MAG: hypothetical protein H0W68_07225, partial [Gemmatimonadaceae bacterium]|nr:hypothetical protein [Gemmatimonadaceae bacterium]
MRQRAARHGACVALILAFAPPIVAQATATVAPTDAIYRAADRLIDAGLVTDAIVGQRPWSRRELARIASEAAASMAAGRADSASIDLLRMSIVQLQRAGRGTVSSNPLRGVVIDAVQRDAPARAIPPNGLGST